MFWTKVRKNILEATEYKAFVKTEIILLQILEQRYHG